MKPGFKPLRDFIALFYPHLCLACERNLSASKEVMCLTCQYELPKTDFHLHPDNPFTEKFWGRIDLHAGAALYYFTKNGKVQQLLHRMKYGGRKDIALEIGRIYGKVLIGTPLFRTIDLIVPIPLHPKKERRRGFNQSNLFAQGLSESMQVPWHRNIIVRRNFTETQTTKSRAERFDNVSMAFALSPGTKWEARHLLLVDDVITTGATLEACGRLLLEQTKSQTKLSMATMAIAEN